MPKTSAPADIWDVPDRLGIHEPLDPDDDRFVDLSAARGDFTMHSLFRRLGFDPERNEVRNRHRFRSVLFCGHRGCGKSTKLRRIAKRLDRPIGFFVVFMDGAKELDTHNLRYVDALFALAKQLLLRLADKEIKIDDVHINRLRDWFTERVEKHEKTRNFALELKTGAQAETGVPFLGKLFAGITSSIKNNSTHKEELRLILRDSFADFAEGFNQLIAASEEAIEKAGQGRKILFIVDGTDRVDMDDATRFFIQDVHQLQAIEGLFIYCAPIHLIYQSNQVNQSFDLVFKLPMVKVTEKGNSEMLETSRDALRNLVYKRAAAELFDSEDTVDYLIQMSGGHPRDLVRLLSYAFDFHEGEQFDEKSAQKAVNQLAQEHRRILEEADYGILYEIDTAEAQTASTTDRIQFLLYNLALLEYNSYWWQSHPTIRTLPGYREAREAAETKR